MNNNIEKKYSSQNIYKYFNCRSKEQLYRKIKKEDPSVKEIIDYINYLKLNKTLDNFWVNSPEKAIEMFSSLPKLRENQLYLIYLDTKLKPVHFRSIFYNEENIEKNVLLDAAKLNADRAMCFISSKDEIEYKGVVAKIDDTLKLLNINIVDLIIENKITKNFYSSEGQKKYNAPNNINNLFNLNGLKEEISDLGEFTEFMDFYATKEIEGKNIYKKKEEIKKSLKASYELAKQENYLVIYYDKNGKINDLKKLNIGNSKSTVIDPKAIIRNFSENEKNNGIILVHNHPSGNTNPSMEDIRSTANIIKMLDKMGVKVADHFIVGKENVYSMQEEQKLDFTDTIYKKLSLIQESFIEPKIWRKERSNEK